MKKSEVPNRGYITVDTEKFKAICEHNGLTRREYAATIGRTHSWCKDVINRGTMHMTDYLAYKAYWGVDLKVEEPKPKKKDPATCEEMLAEILQKLDRIADILETKEVLS